MRGRAPIVENEDERLEIRILATAVRSQLVRGAQGAVTVYITRDGKLHTTRLEPPRDAVVVGAYTRVPHQRDLADDVRCARAVAGGRA